MNAPRDPWEAFSAVFAEELSAAAKWTPEQMDAMADEYQREQIETARSEAAQQEMSK
jgi:hypothetical protein